MAYPILIQAGHVKPLEPGFESGTGTIREAEFTARMQFELGRLFQADGRFKVHKSGGDLPDGWHGAVFLSLHADGSTNPAADGFSFGWDVNNPGQAPALAARISKRFVKLGHPGGPHTNNYTGGLRYYYGWRRITADIELLIEYGFMTKPGEQKWLFDNIRELAEATYDSVLEQLKLPKLRSSQVKATMKGGAVVVEKGNLKKLATVRAIVAPLLKSGKRAPWIAKIDGKVVSNGRLWPPTRKFNRQIRGWLRKGHTVVLNDQISLYDPSV